MISIFIDANTFLKYFLTPNANAASLQELNKLLKEGKAELLLPDQVKHEYLRNHKTKSAEGLAIITKEIGAALPVDYTTDLISANEEVAKKLKEHLASAEKERLGHLQRELENMKNMHEETDRLIMEIFSRAKPLAETPEILERAQNRNLKGNPPRKSTGKVSFGDAIIWESILEHSKTSSSDLIFVTMDHDFTAGQNTLNRLLREDWKAVTSKSIDVFASLGEAINLKEGKKTIKKEVVQQEKKGTVRPSVMGVLRTADPGVVYRLDSEDFGYASSYYSRGKAKFCSQCGRNLEHYNEYGGLPNYRLDEFAIPNYRLIDTTYDNFGNRSMRYCPYPDCGAQL